MFNSIKMHATVFHLCVLLVKRVLLVMQYTCNSFPANRTVAMATGLPRALHQKAWLSLIHSRLLENTQQTFPKHTDQGSLPALMHGHAGFPRLALFTDNDLACCHDPLIRMNSEKGLFKVSLMDVHMPKVYRWISRICFLFYSPVFILLLYEFCK